MAKHLLNDTALRAIKPTDKDQLIGDGEGLFLLVKPDGKKWWRHVYTYQGKRKALSLGVYPQTTLAAARKQATTNREHLANGINPSDLRKQDKAIKAQQQESQQRIVDGKAPLGSFGYIAEEWWDKKMTIRSASHQKRTKGILDRDLLPWLGHRPIADITPAELLKALERIEDRAAIETAHRALQTAGQVIRYAWSKDLVQQDITQALKGALTARKSGNFAAVTEPDQLQRLLRAMESSGSRFVVKSALRLAPLVFVRPGELRQAQWEQIDFTTNQWRYLVTKTQTEHIVPLSRQAVAILQDLYPLTGHGRYCFPSARAPNGSRSISDMALITALRDVGYSGSEMTVHGFRATARTILDEVLNFRVDYIEHQLAHAVKDANGTSYNRTKHLTERAHMLQVWADYLDALRMGAEFKQGGK